MKIYTKYHIIRTKAQFVLLENKGLIYGFNFGGGDGGLYVRFDLSVLISLFNDYWPKYGCFLYWICSKHPFCVQFLPLLGYGK